MSMPAGSAAGIAPHGRNAIVPGATLSRWTMSYFAAALIALVAAELLMAIGYGYPNAPVESAQTLVLVHLVALGWLSLLMCGALFQFVPVLVARPLYSDALPLPTLLCLVAGVVALLLGFLQMGGTVSIAFAFLPTAATLLAIGFGLVLWNLGRTLWAARPLPLPACFVAVGLCSIAVTVTLGIIFSLVLGGVTDNPYLVDIVVSGVPLHAIAGLGGWLTFTAMGVAYRLLAMFMLAPEPGGRRSRAGFYCGTASLAVAVGGGVTAICLAASLTLILVAAGLLGLCALLLYGTDILHLYRARKRRVIELNSRMAGFAMAGLAASVILIAALAGFGILAQHAAAVVFLVAFGWLSGLGLAKLYKIAAFLTWLECYGPVLGKTATPRVQDLAVERRAIRWFLLYFLGVWGATATLLLEIPTVFQACAGLMLIGSLGIIVQLVRIRQLLDVNVTLRLPPGVSVPRLLLCSAQHD
ncbi:conserved membrane hypothetical protein [Hyphomicrobiales bacterium]|nr:conserved membrane hypothetical protein [Hyphomicrobiales bacterium]CAH1696220.1 conserved membrane hypothetical protein [Hyphomicrobiales bacterium]